MTGKIPGYVDIVAVALLSTIFISLMFFLIYYSKKLTEYYKIRTAEAIQRRRNPSQFREDYGYSWDYCIVFKVLGENEGISNFQKTSSMKNVLARLTHGGLETRLSYSVLHTVVFCKIRAPLERLLKEAHRIEYALATDSKKLQALCTEGRNDVWQGLRIPEPRDPKDKSTEINEEDRDDTDETKLNPYDYIYLKYDCHHDTTQHDDWQKKLFAVYKRYPATAILSTASYMPSAKTQSVGSVKEAVEMSDVTFSPLSNVGHDEHYRGVSTVVLKGTDRLKLIKSIMHSKAGGCGLDISDMVHSNVLVAAYPLHDRIELSAIEESWFKFCHKYTNADINLMKDYFGEKVGFYFLCVKFYVSMNAIAGAIGFCFYIPILAGGNNPNNAGIPFFAVFMVIWCTLYLELWKRNEKYFALRWGMVGCETTESLRPTFMGMKTLSAINGKPTYIADPSIKSTQFVKSYGTILGCMCAVCLTLTIIFSIRHVFSQTSKVSYAATIVTSLMIAVQIQVFEMFYTDLAFRLNSLENHRTDTEFEDNLIIKTFLFQFVNAYGGLFYIAFLKITTGEADPCLGSCMLELETTLGCIFLTRLFLGNMVELVLPYMTNWWLHAQIEKMVKRARPMDQNKSHPSKRRSASISGDQHRRLSHSTGNGAHAARDFEGRYEMSEIERNFLMPEYDVMLGPFGDMAEIVIQFGYCTLFAAAFPLAPLMGFVSGFVEMRVDAWKLCQMHRRPEPRSMEDIGSWQDAMELISTSAVFVNIGIIAYTGSFMDNYTWFQKVLMFLVCSVALIALKLYTQWLIPDETSDFKIQLARQEFIASKVLLSIADEEVVSNTDSREIPCFNVLVGDQDAL